MSLRTEPGVLTMYAVAQAAYESHIASEHFRKYKQGTLHMVKSFVLSDQTPLNPASRIVNYIGE